MKYDIEKRFVLASYGVRSHAKAIHSLVLEQGLESEVAQVILDTVASSIISAQPLTMTCSKLSIRIHNLLDVEIPSDRTSIDFGMKMVHLMALTDLIDVEKYPTIVDNKVKEQWYTTSKSQELTEYAHHLSPSKRMPSPLNGYHEWTHQYLFVDGHKIPIVKKAERYGMMEYYGLEKMPDVYASLNRLNSQGFRINKHVLSLTEMAEELGFGFIPEIVAEERRKTALRSLNDVNRKAKFIEELKFKEMNKWLLNEAEVEDEKIITRISKKQASEHSQDYADTKGEPHLKVISDWSKRLDYEKIIKLAAEWSNSVINYIFNCDTRGRIYAIQNFLTPLGSDLAKAMLVFDNEYQISGYDFCIHIANCFGQDKLSFKNRVKWVNDNSEKLQLIGLDPIGNYELIKELGLDGESKTRWQGLAACIEYVSYCEYVSEHGTEEGFTSALIIGLDATASGTQILTILGRDNRVAPYVNVSTALNDKVGDFYTYLSNFLKPKMESHRGFSPTLDDILNNWDKYSRKLSKRNSMTFSYSGTKFGFGQQHWEDRHSYNKEEDDLTGTNLTRSDCRILGNEMYDVCKENIRGGAEIMDWLRSGIDFHTDGAIISWTLPDGFTAFQVCDASRKENISGVIGTRKVTLNYFVFQNKPKKSEHKNAISPNWVHSFDAYLLRDIVRNMPEEAPISTVHDQFSTSSYYIQDLQDVAKRAYKKIGDREQAERICEEAFGIYRPLPEVGNWSLTEIDNAEFIIC